MKLYWFLLSPSLLFFSNHHLGAVTAMSSDLPSGSDDDSSELVTDMDTEMATVGFVDDTDRVMGAIETTSAVDLDDPLSTVGVAPNARIDFDNDNDDEDDNVNPSSGLRGLEGSHFLTTVSVVEDRASFRDAIANASTDPSNPSIIRIAPGTTIDFDAEPAIGRSGLNLNNKYLEIICGEYADETNKCTLERSARGGRFFQFGNNFNVLLAGLVLKGGKAGNGGAISFNLGPTNDCDDGCSATVIDCDFVNNAAENKGGAIYLASYVSTLSLFVRGSTFKSNEVVHSGGDGGGAISAESHMWDESEGVVGLNIFDTTFSGSSLERAGQQGTDILGQNLGFAESSVFLSCSETSLTGTDDDVNVPRFQGAKQMCTTRSPSSSPSSAPSVSPQPSVQPSTSSAPSVSLQPSTSIVPSASPTADPWEVITYDTFDSEKGDGIRGEWGNFAGSKDGKLIKKDNKGEWYRSVNGGTSHGNACLRMQHKGRLYHKDNHNVRAYSKLQLYFQFTTYSFDKKDRFFVEYSSDGGKNYDIVKSFVGKNYPGRPQKSKKKYVETIGFDVKLADGYTKTSRARIRFRMEGNNDKDFVYIDNVRFEGFRESTSAPSDVPTALPTSSPTSPTATPTGSPTSAPTGSPTSSPTESPTAAPMSAAQLVAAIDTATDPLNPTFINLDPSTTIDFDDGTFFVNTNGLNIDNKYFHLNCIGYTADNKCTITRSQGGGQFFHSSLQLDIVILGVAFVGGQATSSASITKKQGGAFHLECTSSPCAVTFIDCDFKRNSASYAGGAVYFASNVVGSTLSLTGCDLKSNSVISNSIYAEGGGAIFAASANSDASATSIINLIIHQTSFSDNSDNSGVAKDIRGKNYEVTSDYRGQFILTCTETTTSSGMAVEVPRYRGKQTCSAISFPTIEPTESPTATPTESPTALPTSSPSTMPTVAPTAEPSFEPSSAPSSSSGPSAQPSFTPCDATTAIMDRASFVEAIENASTDLAVRTQICVHVNANLDFDTPSPDVDQVGLDLTNKYFDAICVGYGDTDKCTLERSNFAGRFFYGSHPMHVSFTGFQFHNGYRLSQSNLDEFTASGGALLFNDGSESITKPSKVTFVDCNFINNTSHGDGGALCVLTENGNDWNLLVNGCNFDSNHAYSYGGGLSIMAAGVGEVALTIMGSQFFDNVADAYVSSGDIDAAYNVDFTCTSTAADYVLVTDSNDIATGEGCIAAQ